MEISVIVPIYNVEKYLTQCIESILFQTYDDYEIICVEDCSSDSSLKIIEQFHEKFTQIKLIRNEQNRGLSYSRNVGLENASGKYVLFVDSDDYLEKETLHILHEYAERQNSEILYFNKSIIYEDNLDENKEREYNEKLNYTEVYTGKELFVEFMHRNIYKSINAYTQFFRTDFLKQQELHFYNGIVHEDYLFYFQCAMKAKRVANIDKQLYVYRKRAQSITTKFEEINKMSVCLVWIELVNYWKNNSFTYQEDRAMEKFADLVYRKCQTYIKLTNSGHKMELGTAADKYIYNRWTQNQFVDFSDEELNQIKKASGVWVYGAGDVGNEVALVLEKSNISITGYIVSDKSKSRQKVWGWTVYQLDEITRHSDDVFIIASIRYPTEMKKNLLEMGVKNIIYAAKSEKWKEDIT